MKTRWYITVESEAQNMEEFDSLFFEQGELVVGNEFIVGVVKEVREINQ
jgi:hypothetical protein